jgi:hypothetical protein
MHNHTLIKYDFQRLVRESQSFGNNYLREVIWEKNYLGRSHLEIII